MARSWCASSLRHPRVTALTAQWGVPKRAVILSGSLGAGHDVICEVVTGSLTGLGWESHTLDSMAMLGRRAGRAGDWVFRELMKMPAVFDALHFAHLRPGSRLAAAMDRAATSRLVPALQAELLREPADLIVAAFATGASAAAQLAGPARRARTVVLCCDAAPHSAWVRDGIDLFLVTSPAAAASVRRYVPQARVCVVPPPVRPAFYRPPTQAAARQSLDVPTDARCVLLMGGGWGLGPLEQAAGALAAAGVHVLAVAGHNRQLAGRLAALADREPRVHPFGYTERIVELMAACDVVVTLPGATTCGEARVVGRRLVLLDAMPGHGRENLQHELELGGADAGNPRPSELTASVLAALDRAGSPLPGSARPAGEWDRAFAAALASIGVELAPQPPGPADGQAAPGIRPNPQEPQEAGHS
jgi:processive 1,2-diacylglycerol beta-glucosyltransferase